MVSPLQFCPKLLPYQDSRVYDDVPLGDSILCISDLRHRLKAVHRCRCASIASLTTNLRIICSLGYLLLHEDFICVLSKRVAAMFSVQQMHVSTLTDVCCCCALMLVLVKQTLFCPCWTTCHRLRAARFVCMKDSISNLVVGGDGL